MIDTLPELMEYLEMRGDKYGIPAEELLEAIPEDARTPTVAYEYMQEKDISHKVPLSKGGETAGDNWILEDSSVNRSRGAENMTPEEEATAEADAQADAERLNKAQQRQYIKTIAVGGSLTAGSSIVEGAVLAGQAVGGIAAVGAEATFITTVVVPVVVTGAIIAAVGGAGWWVWKKLA